MAGQKPPESWDDLYPGRFLKAGNLHGKPATITIADVQVETLGRGEQAKKRAVLTLKGTTFQWAPCVTDGLALRAMFGESPADYIGKRITIAPTQVQFGAETVPAIRIIGSPDIPGPVSKTYQRAGKTIAINLRKTES